VRSRTACFYARRTIELMVEWVYTNDSPLQRPWGHCTLADLIFADDALDGLLSGLPEVDTQYLRAADPPPVR
jgi:hypothetical protein